MAKLIHFVSCIDIFLRLLAVVCGVVCNNAFSVALYARTLGVTYDLCAALIASANDALRCRYEIYDLLKCGLFLHRVITNSHAVLWYVTCTGALSFFMFFFWFTVYLRPCRPDCTVRF